MNTPGHYAAALRAVIVGEVIAEGEAGWDSARQAWNLTADQRPPLVVMAVSAQDIAATVRFAAENGLRVAPQSTGHGASSMGRLAGTILLKTSRLRAVTVDPGARSATVGAGALWSDAIAPPAWARSGRPARHVGGARLAGMSSAAGIRMAHPPP